jgi:uncharacterized membrane protein YraQ (UPF0718 family)
LKDRRLFLSGALLLAIALHFWAGSRIPQLNEKALMGGDTQLNALGFETVLQVEPTDPLLLRTLYTSVNWMETNRKGMTFGIIFGAVLMMIISLMEKKSAETGLGNTLLGMVIGAPLGVCVNCAAPIAKGLHSGGARIELMLAAMISSPTLNVIVLTMLFSLYPLYIVSIKLGLTLGFILIVIPVASRLLYRAPVVSSDTEKALMGDASCPIPVLDPPPDSWLQAARWVAINFAKRLWYVVRMTVPLMFLAGFLGSLLITILPWQSLADVSPDPGSILIPLSMIAIASVGLALPVPIAFDVLVPAILMAAGMEIRYVMILLFTLGIFSIYPFFIIWKSVGRTMALALPAILLCFGVGAGVLGEEFFQRDLAKQRALFFDVFGSAEKTKGPSALSEREETPPGAGPALVAQLRERRLAAEPVAVAGPVGISVVRTPFSRQPGTRATGFERITGRAIGLDDEASQSVFSFISLSRFRPIATGDVHNDGWTDALIASDGRLALYANEGGGRFRRQMIGALAMRDHHVVNAALVDLNDDGWLDIFCSTYRAGNYVLYNQEGVFLEDRVQLLPNREGSIMTASATFGDLDRDGDLDVALGNYTLGALSGSWTSEFALNVLLRNEPKGFETTPLPGGAGETQSTLFSDFNGDGALDLIVGNDFQPADYYYLGDGTGRLDVLTREDDLVPHSTWSTMSLASGDIDNDLVPELYVGQITGFSGNGAVDRRGIDPATCREFRSEEDMSRCESVMRTQKEIVRSRGTKDPFRCFSLEKRYHEDCVAVLLLASAAQWNRSPELCDLFPESWSEFGFVCRESFRDDLVPSEKELAAVLPQIRSVNSLMKRDGDGPYREVAPEMGVETGGWTWTAKFADLDNDEWQDLYIVNGEFASTSRESNFFFRNRQGQGFQDETAEFGLESYLATGSYSYVDLDNDGDLDIIVLPMWGPASIYLNSTGGENAIAFEIRDDVGNHFGIGTKIILHYGSDESRHQIRELQAGGGFASFDAPIAHFGLGEYEDVTRVEIHWSTGEHSELRGDFSAGARYVVRRGAGSESANGAEVVMGGEHEATTDDI